MTDSCGKCGCHSFALLYGMFCIYISYRSCDIELSVEGQHIALLMKLRERYLNLS